MKELNTVFLRAVGRDGTIYKVPYSFKRVPGSFTGEALCAELIEEISEIRPLKENAAQTILDIIKKNKQTESPEVQLKRIHLQIQVMTASFTKYRTDYLTDKMHLMIRFCTR